MDRSGLTESLQFLCFAVAAFLLIALSFTQLAAAQEPTQQSPNIVVILADDMGWNDVGYNGSEIRTPTLDRLAANGIELTDFHVQPTCSPTRSSLMTGQSAVRLGVVAPISKNAQRGLPLDVRILPQYLKEAGYQTALVGKWHLGHARQAMHPNARGFDHFYGHVTGGIGYWDHVHGGGYDWQRNGETVREEGYTTHLIADEAVQLIEDRDGSRPMFLYLALNAPHLPNEAPEEIINQYAEIENPYRKVHAAMVTELDTAIGRVLRALEDEGMADNTLIWFMSDNGGLNRESSSPGLVGWIDWLTGWFGRPLPTIALEFLRVNAEEGGADNGPFRGGKSSVWEGGTHVPSIVYWPGRLVPGAKDARITIQDVMPTVLSAAGLSNISTPLFDGVDQWLQLTTDAKIAAPDFVTKGIYGEAYYQDDWKLLAHSEDELELYNLADDPYEKTDVATLNPSVVEELSGKLKSVPRGEPVNPPLWRIFWDPDFFGGEEDREPWADVMKD